jgi:hypothetical protein
VYQRFRGAIKAQRGDKVASVVVERETKADMSWAKDETRLSKYRGVASWGGWGNGDNIYMTRSIDWDREDLKAVYKAS